MQTSQSIVKITPAFLTAQKNIESVIKDSTNPYFKSKYADLTSVIEACKDKLNKVGIAVLQPINNVHVETVLLHESGEWFSSSTPIVSKVQNDPQALGSAISYAKRYGLQSMVLLPAVDDDGNQASNKAKIESFDREADMKFVSADNIPGVEKIVTEAPKNGGFCAVHKVPMKQFTKNGKSWFSHKDEVEGYCHGAGYKSQINK